MSISGITALPPTKTVAHASTKDVPVTGGGTTVPYGVGAAGAGGYVAQGVPGTGSLIKKMLLGGVVGAGVGFGASFLTLPVVGAVAAPIAAAVGAGVGALGGAVWHFVSKRKANLAMEAQVQQQMSAVQQPTTVPTPAVGTTLRVGSKGGATKTLQGNLKKLGLFPYPVSGAYDKATANAVRRFELMKGVQPTGLASPDLRTAVEQDAGLTAQYLVS